MQNLVLSTAVKRLSVRSAACIRRSLPRTYVDWAQGREDGGRATRRDQEFKCYRCGEQGHRASECSQPRTDVTCYSCGEQGHVTRDCPKARCFTCGETGHMSSSCPRGGQNPCFNCGEPGHTQRDCTAEPKEGITQERRPLICLRCGVEGHMARDCDQPRKITCRRCGQEGHIARECPTEDSRLPTRRTSDFRDSRDSRRGGGYEAKDRVCYKCQQMGHIAANCPNEAAPRRRESREY